MATKRKLFNEVEGRDPVKRKAGTPSLRGDPRVDMVELAGKFRSENKHDEAIHCYEKVLSGNSEKSGVVDHARMRRSIIECLCAKGEYTEALKISEEMKSYLSSEVESIAKELENIRFLAATINLQIGSYDAAEVECQEVLRNLDGKKDLEKMKEIFMTLGSVSLHLGDLNSARRYYEDCFKHLGEEEKSLELAKVVNHLAQLHFVESEWKESLEHLTRALRISESVDDARLTASIIGNMGTVHLLIGEWERAEEELRKSLDMWNKLGDLLAIVRKYLSLGNLFMMRRDWKSADNYYSMSRELSREKGYMRELCLSLEFSGELEFERKNYGLANDYYHEALSLAMDIAPEGDLIGELNRRVAELRVKTGDLAGAHEACEISLECSYRLRDRYEEAIVYRIYGQIYDAMGEIERARHYFTQGIDGLTAIDEHYERAKTHLEAATFITRRFESASDFMQAERHFRSAAEIFDRLGIDHYVELVKREWDQLKAKQSKLTAV
jgi:pentatricopeptide repeat protein